MKLLPVINVPAGTARASSRPLTFHEATKLGYAIDVRRELMNGRPGWWFEVLAHGQVVAEGWTIGYGPRAKTQAMKDALEAVAAREVLRSFITSEAS